MTEECLADARELQRQADALGPWFHNLHLPGGVQTVPDHWLGDFPSFKWRLIAEHLPERLDGWRVLDIGCNAGFHSFQCANRGADVLAIDVDPHYLAQARWAADVLGVASRITFRQMQIYDVARLSEQFDLVLFMGVFYHLRHPLLGLEVAARTCGKQFVFQSLTMEEGPPEASPEDLPLERRAELISPAQPRMTFVEHRLAGDPTNWWVPNEAAVEALLRSVGLRVVARPDGEMRVCVPEAGYSDPYKAEYRAALGLDR